MIGKITDFLISEWVGKPFVYQSKYGEVVGEIESVHVSYTYMWDQKTEEKFKKIMQSKKDRDGSIPFPNEPDIMEVNAYTAIRPTISIWSTEGIYYDFNEIFIITHKSSILK